MNTGPFKKVEFFDLSNARSFDNNVQSVRDDQVFLMDKEVSRVVQYLIQKGTVK